MEESNASAMISFKGKNPNTSRLVQKGFAKTNGHLSPAAVQTSEERVVRRLLPIFWLKKIGSNRRTTLQFIVCAICKKKEGAKRDEQVFRPNR
jgi:hypothetical protein